jgi:hypothetical protein
MLEAGDISDKDLIAQHVRRVIIKGDRIELEVRGEDREELGSARNIQLPFSLTVAAQKGITREPQNNGRSIPSHGTSC